MNLLHSSLLFRQSQSLPQPYTILARFFSQIFWHSPQPRINVRLLIKFLSSCYTR
jgi:hypothetical protein